MRLEHTTLERLRKDTSIMVLPANKGCAMVVMDKPDSLQNLLTPRYNKEPYKQYSTESRNNNKSNHQTSRLLPPLEKLQPTDLNNYDHATRLPNISINYQRIKIQSTPLRLILLHIVARLLLE